MAEAQTTVRIAKQFGIAYLPLTIMEQKQVLEEHGRRRRLDLKTEWMQFVSGAPMNEATLSGKLDLASGSVGPPDHLGQDPGQYRRQGRLSVTTGFRHCKPRAPPFGKCCLCFVLRGYDLLHCGVRGSA
jgi:hypothetical protein